MSFSIYDALMELSSDDYPHNNALSPILASQQPTPQTNNNDIRLLDLDAPNNQETTPKGSVNMHTSAPHTSMMPFLGTREICLEAMFVKVCDMKSKDDEDSLRKDRNFLNMVVRSAVLSSGSRSLKAFEAHRLLRKIKEHVPNLDLDNKEVVRKLKRKLLVSMNFLKSRQVSVDKDYSTSKSLSAKRTLPTDDFDRDSADLMKIGNLISLFDYNGISIAKANVVAYPCTDLYIKDHENPDEWVSVMLHTKRRNSKIDYLPSNNAHQQWEEIGRKSFVSWPVAMVDSVEKYNKFSLDAVKERRATKRILQKPGPRRRLPFLHARNTEDPPHHEPPHLEPPHQDPPMRNHPIRNHPIRNHLIRTHPIRTTPSGTTSSGPTP